jgi:hypothetical protein
MGVGEVGAVGGTVVDHGLIDGVSSLIREDTGRKARDELLDTELVRALDDVVVHRKVVVVELDGLSHVDEQAANKGSKVNNMSRLILVKDSLTDSHVTKITILGTKEDKLISTVVSLDLGVGQNSLNTLANKTSSTSDENDTLIHCCDINQREREGKSV